MALNIYNSLSRTKERFVPLKKGQIKMYVCGMTVYSDAHIGHARTYVAFDVIRRYFEYSGYKVTYVQNITDVDDKIITAANKEGVAPLSYAERFAQRCLDDLDALGIRRADLYPTASSTIPDMIAMIQEILKNGYGYEANGDVYFSVEKMDGYGKLSGQNIDQMKAGARIEPGDLKKNPLDFALWKSAKPGEPSWDSPWGKGRPGWHIECSAMSGKYLGLPFDIHGGGMDLRFPHHENEIAQAEAATGKQFTRYWLHAGLLTMNGEKMSKSIGNIINVRDILQRRNPEVVRMFIAQAHYRSPPDFTEKSLDDVEKGLERIYRVKERFQEHAANSSKKKLVKSKLNKEEQLYLTAIQEFQEQFEEAMDDDFNTPKAFATLFEFVNKSNKYLENNPKSNDDLFAYALEVLLKIGEVLTLFQPKTVTQEKEDPETIKKLQVLLQQYGKSPASATLDVLLQTVLDLREEMRRKKEWKTADHLRKELEILGFEIQDTDSGPVWRKK